MGIVFNQSYKNIIIIAFALLIGGVNTLYFYPVFLKEQYYGLVVFLLATSNLLQPIISFFRFDITFGCLPLPVHVGKNTD